MIHRARFAMVCALVAASLASVSCGSDKDGPKPLDAGLPDASKEPIVGGKLGQVLASAASAAASGAPTAKSNAGGADQPPESGIFLAGDADKRQPRDAPPKIDVISEGVDPKVTFAAKLDAPEQKTTLSVAMRMGQGRLPTIDFAVSIKPEKASKPKEAAPASTSAPAASGSASAGAAAPPTRMAATVTGTTLPPTQGLSKDLADAIGKLKGTVVRWDQTASGAASNFAVELPKGAGEGLELVIDALVDSLSMFVVPLPPKPIGKDGYWIAADRARAAAGIDLVRYRVFKILKVDGDAITLSVDVRQYSADQKIKLDTAPGQKTELALMAFDSQGKGTVVWKPDSFLPLRGEVKEGIAAQLNAGGGAQPGRGAPVVQTELTSTIGGGPTPADKP